MNKDVIVIAKRDENIKRIKTIFELIGYNIFLADDLNFAFNLVERFTPLAILVAEEDKDTTQIYIKELKRHLPITPIIVLMSEKNNIKKELYLKDVYEVIDYPWTEIMISQVLNLIEIKSIKNQELKKETKQKSLKDFLYLTTIIIMIVLSFVLFLKLTPSKIDNEKNKTKEIKIPSKNITGFFEKDNNYYFYDWAIQSFYVIEKRGYDIVSIKNFFTPYIITSIKDSGLNSFFALTDNGEIKKFLKNDKFSEVYSINNTDYNSITDICYDGMYIWILKDNYIAKIFDNEKAEIIERYLLPEEISGTNHIECSKDQIFYYKDSKIYIANIKNPVQVDKKLTIDNKIISLNYLDEKLFLIISFSNNSIVKEISI